MNNNQVEYCNMCSGNYSCVVIKSSKEEGNDWMLCPSCYQELYSEDDSPISQEVKTTKKQEIYKFKVGQTAEQFFETLDKVDTKHTDFTRKTVSTITKMTKHTIYVKEEVYDKINSQWVFKNSTPPRQYRFKHLVEWYGNWEDMVKYNTNFPCMASKWK